MKLRKLDESRWEIPREGAMRVPGIVYADEAMMKELRDDPALEQVKNVAVLPGIVKASFAMPDIHWGYGFPIGGVAAFDLDGGVVTPGGIGFDINCGVRLLRTDLNRGEVKSRLKQVADGVNRAVPAGVGSRRRDLSLSDPELREVMRTGAQWAISRGLGWQEDLERMEEGGAIAGADPDTVSERAIVRGRDQLGTLGSGNHFAEVDYIDEIYDGELADAFGLFKGQVVVQIHTGSRGFGYQICDDHLVLLNKNELDFKLPDRQLACAYLGTPLAARYLGAMRAAVNFAFCNRQVIAHRIREAFEQIFGDSNGMHLLYDVAHNIAKEETHELDGEPRRLLVHRKGAIRAFGPGHPDLPAMYRETGQPVIIPGDMGRASFVLAGAAGAMKDTFGTACHGAGRRMSRSKAKKKEKGQTVVRRLEQQGILVRGASLKTIAEEMPEAYKDVREVVGVVDAAGLARRVARLRPMAVVKG